MIILICIQLLPLLPSLRDRQSVPTAVSLGLAYNSLSELYNFTFFPSYLFLILDHTPFEAELSLHFIIALPCLMSLHSFQENSLFLFDGYLNSPYSV